MDGFNVLNTTEAQVSGASIALGVFASVITLIIVLIAVCGFLERQVFGGCAFVVLALLFGTMAYVLFTVNDIPTRYEITLKPGDVIDAARYEIVEQHGEIYVIQERKHP